MSDLFVGRKSMFGFIINFAVCGAILVEVVFLCYSNIRIGKKFLLDSTFSYANDVEVNKTVVKPDTTNISGFHLYGVPQVVEKVIDFSGAVLNGVFESNDTSNNIAIISIGSEAKLYQVGQIVLGALITKISKNEITLEHEGKTILLKIQTPELVPELAPELAPELEIH